jgi:phosphatidylglycerophosphate synthase
MIGNKIGHRLDPYLFAILKIFLGQHGNPNLFTFMGFFATLVASFFILKEFWLLAGLTIILSGLLDLFDGVVARKLGKATALGSFLDILIHYLIKEDSGLAILTFFVSMGTVLIPYIRAKAEALGVPCTIGLMERAERIILLSIGALFLWMEPILWILAILTHFTGLQRIYYVWKRLRSPLENENPKHQIPNPK